MTAISRLAWSDDVGANAAHDASPVLEEGSATPRTRDARSDLLNRIADFIMRHDLDVTSANLAVLCNALSGSNTPLAEAFVQREISGQPIDQRWLNTLVRLDPDARDRLAELDALMDQLEYTLIRFGQTAKSAVDETHDQRGALDAQVGELDAGALGDMSAPEMSCVIELSRTMLSSIVRLENAMVKSQEEAENLRENLAKARMEADIDHLTRLPNRRAFERRLTTVTAQAHAKGEPLCVAFCDIDHFKDINDRHGHEAGDRILCAVASTLNRLAGDDCFVARHGGEEFVLLFYGLSKDAALDKLNGVRRAMAAKQLMNRETGRPFGKLTFSGGLAEVADPNNPRSALARADAALYEAKEAGRNRIVAH
ncbi:MAG: GGDEF domain-containing protein [Erythrobacter sp.]|uniref:GGDEF domain-containing protein n=1 Tax=Erythrobacter sp. TaxID=1042 RepID=UPI002614FA3D|nr:GGDEF domain-containing protein [Erythrobacter sp.]MDJ0979162.1 GGDEF domain-containing protein [Erythrobacter sp.]